MSDRGGIRAQGTAANGGRTFHEQRLQAGVIEFLAAKSEPVTVTELSEQCDASHSVVQALVKKGLVVTESAARSVTGARRQRTRGTTLWWV